MTVDFDACLSGNLYNSAAIQLLADFWWVGCAWLLLLVAGGRGGGSGGGGGSRLSHNLTTAIPHSFIPYTHHTHIMH